MTARGLCSAFTSDPLNSGFRCWACSSSGRAHATGATDRIGMSKLTRREAAAASRGSRAQSTSKRRGHTDFVWQPSPQPRCPLPSRAAVRCGQPVQRDLADHDCSDDQATRVPGQHHSACLTPSRLATASRPLTKAAMHEVSEPLKSQHLKSTFSDVNLGCDRTRPVTPYRKNIFCTMLHALL